MNETTTTTFLASCAIRSLACSGREARVRRPLSCQMQWEFMPPIRPSVRVRPTTHHSKLALLFHHARHGDGGADVGAHDGVVSAKEVHLAAAAAATATGSAAETGGTAKKDR